MPFMPCSLIYLLTPKPWTWWRFQYLDWFVFCRAILVSIRASLALPGVVDLDIQIFCRKFQPLCSAQAKTRRFAYI
ncbi:hypothetical protein C8J56DRAFT_423835 [Mycena floridula]|nr:hypothetical protein C8J56DRAFT_423835 [Mycena floridula]